MTIQWFKQTNKQTNRPNKNKHHIIPHHTTSTNKTKPNKQTKSNKTKPNQNTTSISSQKKVKPFVSSKHSHQFGPISWRKLVTQGTEATVSTETTEVLGVEKVGKRRIFSHKGKWWGGYHSYGKFPLINGLLVGGFSPTPLKKICSSKWIHLPQSSGWKLKENETTT